MQNKKEIEKEIYDLLNKYHHYKFMTAGFFNFKGWGQGMNLGDFFLWLKSRE